MLSLIFDMLVDAPEQVPTVAGCRSTPSVRRSEDFRMLDKGRAPTSCFLLAHVPIRCIGAV